MANVDPNLAIVADTFGKLSSDAADIGLAFYGVPQAQATAMTAQSNAALAASESESNKYYAIGAGLIAAAFIGAIVLFKR